MRILVAPDKFKASLGALDIAAAIASGLQDALPDAAIRQLPVADGGEGTAEVICAAAGGEWRSCEVQDALGDLVTARYCKIGDRNTAVLQVSDAVGLARVPRDRRDVDRASSYGVGELLLHAAGDGADRVVIGLGGSATNDGGYGFARALGFRFFDSAGRLLGPRASDLLQLAAIKAPADLHLPAITAASDVTNPLLGPRGATRVFGPQKGAMEEQLEMLEFALSRLADVAARDFGLDHRDSAGAGAAGGIGFALLTFCGAHLRPGLEVVAECIALEDAILAADVVITGEGRLDAQTLDGKAPAGVARLARRAGKPVYAIVGELEESSAVRELFDAIFVITNGNVTRADAIANPAPLLRERAHALGGQLAR